MKLISTKTTGNNKLTLDDAIFDPNLITKITVDKKENVFMLEYDFEECGHPLCIPFECSSAEFYVKITPHNIHIGAVIEPSDGCLPDECSGFAGELGEIEFDVRMTPEEKTNLLIFLLLRLATNDETKGSELQYKKAIIPKMVIIKSTDIL